MAVAVSLTLCTLSAQAVLWLRVWNPSALLAALGGLSLLALAVRFVCAGPLGSGPGAPKGRRRTVVTATGELGRSTLTWGAAPNPRPEDVSGRLLVRLHGQVLCFVSVPRSSGGTAGSRRAPASASTVTRSAGSGSRPCTAVLPGGVPARRPAAPAAPVAAAVVGRVVRPSDVLLPLAVATWLFALAACTPARWTTGASSRPCPWRSSSPSAFSWRPSPSPSPTPSGRRYAWASTSVALVLVLHGTVPLIFPGPNYPWVYKHIGVVGYINLHGGLDPSVDIYQNWPGFFAVAAWFTRIAGVGSPLAFAKWAPLFFNLFFCLELAFVLWALPLTTKVRWVALFLFVPANWVGQDYFAPQALTFGLSLAVYGMVLTWLRVDRRPAVGQGHGRAGPAGGRRRERAPSPRKRRCRKRRRRRPRRTAPGGWARRFVLGTIVGTFAVIVVSHQLSPFLILLGLGLLVMAGVVRPRWVVVVMAALALAYLAEHLAFLRNDGDLAGSPFNPRDVLGALSNPFDNADSGRLRHGPAHGRPAPHRPGGPGPHARPVAARRPGGGPQIRRGRPTLVLVLLATSPAVLSRARTTAGRRSFASTSSPCRGRWRWPPAPWRRRRAAGRRHPDTVLGGRAVMVGVALSVLIVLFMSAFYGSIELYRVRPGAVTANQYFFDHARAGSVLGTVSPNVPSRVSARYDEFDAASTPPALSTVEVFLGHVLGRADLPALARLYREHADTATGDVYLSLSTDQQVYVEVLGLMPRARWAVSTVPSRHPPSGSPSTATPTPSFTASSRGSRLLAGLRTLPQSPGEHGRGRGC